MEKLKQALEIFTSNDPIRSWMLFPFNIGEHTYATNASVIIKVPKIGVYDLIDNEKNKERVIELFQTEYTPFITIKTSKLKEALKAVPLINELEITEKECSECNGTGEVEWEFGYHTKEDECPECDGHGYTEKKIKSERKVKDQSKKIKIGEYVMSVFLMEQLLEVCELLNQKSFEVLSHEKINKGMFVKVGKAEMIMMPVYTSLDDLKNVAYSFNKNIEQKINESKGTYLDNGSII